MAHTCSRVLGAFMTAVLLLAGCASDDEPAAESPSPASTPMTSSVSPSPEAAPTEEAEPAQPAPMGTVITSGDSPFGTMLYNDRDQAIYIWEVEQSATPQCYGDCARAWPPVLTDGEPVAAGQVQAGLLGTSQRDDGTTQVTYNGHPLYYYVDEGPGEVRCHNVATHGGLWWVVQPNGDRAP